MPDRLPSVDTRIPFPPRHLRDGEGRASVDRYMRPLPHTLTFHDAVRDQFIQLS